MRRAQVLITHQLLKSALGLPGDEVLAVAQESIDLVRGTFRVLLGGADLPVISEGAEPPFLQPNGDGKFVR